MSDRENAYERKGLSSPPQSTLLDQFAWDAGELHVASRVSLLSQPQPPARPTAPEVVLSAEDSLKVHGPLIPAPLAGVASVAAGEELNLLDKRKSTCFWLPRRKPRLLHPTNPRGTLGSVTLHQIGTF